MKRIILTIVRGLFTFWIFGSLFLFLSGEMHTDNSLRYAGQLTAALIFSYLGILCLRSTLENKRFWSNLFSSIVGYKARQCF